MRTGNPMEDSFLSYFDGMGPNMPVEKTAIGFKYEIGQKVHSKLHRKNGMIEYRMCTETLSESFNDYGVMLWGEDGATTREEIREDWLEGNERHYLSNTSRRFLMDEEGYKIIERDDL